MKSVVHNDNDKTGMFKKKKQFNEKSSSDNEIIPDWAHVWSPTDSSNSITGAKQQQWINFHVFACFWGMFRSDCELK